MGHRLCPIGLATCYVTPQLQISMTAIHFKATSDTLFENTNNGKSEKKIWKKTFAIGSGVTLPNREATD